MPIRFYLILIFFFITKVPVYGQEAFTQSQDQLLYDEALIAQENGNLNQAREKLEKILTHFPYFSQIQHVRQEWQRLMWGLIHSKIQIPGALLYEVKAGDTLDKIAKAHGTTVELIKKRNQLINDHVKPRQKLSVWNRPFVIVVNKKVNLLSLNYEHKIVKVYRVSTGKSETTTPLGEFTIQSRYPNPTWFHHGEIVEPGAPENYLGTRWLGFNKPKYGIHGTIYPELIGQSVSGGCIRMKNKDVEQLYDMVPIGTKVLIVEQ